jgi:hypothetical protein
MKDEESLPLMEALAARKDAIIAEWLAQTLRTYPEHTSRFLGRERDAFRNPVGHTLREALPVLLEAALGGPNGVRVASALDSIVRIRAVQDFTAGQAVAFLFLLKPIIRHAVGRPPHPSLSPWEGGEDKGEGASQAEDLLALEKRIDEMALLAFDLFMQCRERLYEIRANEVKRRFGVWLRRQDVEERTGETENRGNGDRGRGKAGNGGTGEPGNRGTGDGGSRFADSPVPRFSISPIQDGQTP